jgi:hypothetical protein
VEESHERMLSSAWGQRPGALDPHARVCGPCSSVWMLGEGADGVVGQLEHQ